MKSKLFTGFLFLQFFCACNNEGNGTTSENDVDAARNFIQSALEGIINLQTGKRTHQLHSMKRFF
jgi:hypothetical protein